MCWNRWISDGLVQKLIINQKMVPCVILLKSSSEVGFLENSYFWKVGLFTVTHGKRLVLD